MAKRGIQPKPGAEQDPNPFPPTISGNILLQAVSEQENGVRDNTRYPKDEDIAKPRPSLPGVGDSARNGPRYTPPHLRKIRGLESAPAFTRVKAT